jgi:hypothetical protein
MLKAPLPSLIVVLDLIVLLYEVIFTTFCCNIRSFRPKCLVLGSFVCKNIFSGNVLLVAQLVVKTITKFT